MLGKFFKHVCVFIFLANAAYGSAQDNTPLSVHSDKSIIDHTDVDSTETTTTQLGVSQSNASQIDLTHKGREIGKIDSNIEVSSSTHSNKITGTETTPLYIIPSKNDGKQTVSKKGVIFDNMSPNNSTTSQTTESTIHSKSTLIKSSESNVNHGEDTKNFVVPVVALIFSIPLVGLLFIGFYKFGSEWWQHRHYRRMDFLIEGMYNN